MKIAIATRQFTRIAPHAGKTRQWLMYELPPDGTIRPPRRIVLEKAELIHYFDDRGAHPLDGADWVVTASAGDGFVRHMAQRGARVIMTSEQDPESAVRKLAAGRKLPAPRFNVTRFLCKARDLFSRH